MKDEVDFIADTIVVLCKRADVAEKKLAAIARLTKRECECGDVIYTNDPYMLDAWDGPEGWHTEGSFTAGKYHRAIKGETP